MRTEVDLLEKRIRERFVKAFVTYHLLEDGDHVLVGLSGGKDSLCQCKLPTKYSTIAHLVFLFADAVDDPCGTGSVSP